MELDVCLLSRIQFALTVMFHYIFPPLSIGLGLLLVLFEGLFLKTKDKEYETIARFLTSLFAVIFAMGVASGIVMEFQFGTNWANYSRFVGDVFGPALAAEGIFAFFLESSFLGLLVFGWDKVSPKTHFVSTVIVFLGAVLSSVWIVVANSWQQTPAGFVFNEELNRAEITNFWEVVFNPSTPHRLGHVWIGAFILGSYFVLALASYYLLKNKHVSIAQKMFKVSAIVALIFSLAVLLTGHFQAKNLAVTQPAKLAAFEGLFATPQEGEGAALYAWGWPDEEDQDVKLGLGVPGGLSFLLYEDFSASVRGLDQFPREDWPPVNVTFQTYHIMVALGMLFIAAGMAAVLFLWKGTAFEKKWLLRALLPMPVLAIVANEAGWGAAEVGRQPWIVYGLLRTEDAFSPVLDASQVIFSIVMFSAIYVLLFCAWIFVMNQKIQKGPQAIVVNSEEQGR